MATRRELVEAIGKRYRAGTRRQRRDILDEFVVSPAITASTRSGPAARRCAEQAAQPAPSASTTRRCAQALIVLWEACRPDLRQAVAGRWCRSWSRRWSGTVIFSLDPVIRAGSCDERRDD